MVTNPITRLEDARGQDGAGRYAPDPASLMLTSGARRLLERAYDRPGEWVMTRLADPNPFVRRRLASMGINLDGPDNASASSGRGLNARSRWMRAFVRALYREHRWHSSNIPGIWRTQKRTTPRASGALRIDVGRRMPAMGVIPAGRAIRIKMDTGGRAKAKAVQRLPDRSRIFDDRGDPAARWSDPALRDW